VESELKELLGFLFQRADATQTFWNFYAGAVTAVLGLVTAGKPAWLNVWVRSGITAAFLVFAVANFAALNSIRTQRDELMAVASEMKGYSRIAKVVAAVKPATKWELRGFHGALDVAVVIAIWGIPFARRRYELTSRR
jgi:hypothetical protein